MLGVWLAGAAYLPLDPGYPAGRLGFMLADSGAGLLVAAAGRAAGLGGAGWPRCGLDDPAGRAELAGMPGVPPPGVVAAGQLAYVIYTSGSTGAPKGVAVPHGGRGEPGGGAAAAASGAGPGVRVLQFASFSFDASVLDVAVTLAAGGCWWSRRRAERAEPGCAGRAGGAGRGAVGECGAVAAGGAGAPAAAAVGA